MTWRDNAACHPFRIPSDTEHNDFFSSSIEGYEDRKAAEKRALACCQECEVRRECLADGLTVPVVVGIWGGRKLLNDHDRQNARIALAKGKV